MIIALKTLAEHIAARLKQRAFCVIFEDDLERCWPSERAEREKEIQFFAKSQGWTVAILTADCGIRAIFRKPKQGAASHEGSSAVPRGNDLIQRGAASKAAPRLASQS
jgi:hypothetical protein